MISQQKMHVLLVLIGCFALNPAALLAYASSCENIESIALDTTSALADIYANQHPPDCSTARYLLCQRSHLGNFGSKLLATASCIGWALQINAVAIQATGALGVGNLFEQLSPFKPWSNCTLDDAMKVQDADPDRVTLADFVHFPTPDHNAYNHEQMHVDQALYNSIPDHWNKRGKVWWKAVELFYTLRPAEETQEVLDAIKRQLGWTAERDDYVHGMHIRRGDKIGTESHYFPFMYYVEALANMTSSTSDAQDVFIATDDRPAVHLETEPFNKLRAHFLPEGPLNSYKGPAHRGNLGVALDILLLSQAKTLTLTASSNFGLVSLYINLVRHNFCMNFTTLDMWHPTWWGPEIFHGGKALDVYQPVDNIHNTTEEIAWSHTDLWMGQTYRYIGPGSRGDFRPIAEDFVESKIYLQQPPYNTGGQMYLCRCR